MSDGSGWHLQKNVSVGHIITTLVVSVSAVLWMSNIQQGVKRNAEAIERAITLVDVHVGSGPHAEASVRLTRLEVITEQLVMDGRETRSLLREIRDELREKPFNGAGN